MKKASRKGPIEDTSWPSDLEARVSDNSGPCHRLRGYALRDDLAANYSFSQVLLLAMTGELPTKSQSRIFDAVLISLGDTLLADAVAHAALLARITGSRTASVVGIVGIVAAEDGALVAKAWQTLQTGGRDATLRSSSARERREVAALLKACGQPRELPAEASRLSLRAAHAALLGACGLRHEWQFLHVAAMARCTVALAESYDRPMPGFADYPMDRPSIRYEAK